MNSSCKVSIDLEPPEKGFFVPLDIIRGKVSVNIAKSTSVENIQIKLEGLSETKVYKRVTGADGKSRRKQFCEAHELLYDVNTLFPPDNVKEVSNSAKFTLVPGTYTYEFQFQLPFWTECSTGVSFEGSNLANSEHERTRYDSHTSRNKGLAKDVAGHKQTALPPSFAHKGSEDSVSVGYFVKATVRRASMFSTNARLIVPIKLKAPDEQVPNRGLPVVVKSDEALLSKKLPKTKEEGSQRKRSIFSIFTEDSSSKHKASIQLQAHLTDQCITPGSVIPIRISLLSTLDPMECFIKTPKTLKSNGVGVFQITNLKVFITGSTIYSADHQWQDVTSVINLVDQQEPISIDFKDAEQTNEVSANRTRLHMYDITPIINKEMILPQDTVQSFICCNVERRYFLHVELKISRDPNSRSSSKPIAAVIPFSVTSGVLSAGTTAPMNYDRPPQDESTVPGSQNEIDALEAQLHSSLHVKDGDQLPSYSQSAQ